MKAVLFDLDGIITDTAEYHYLAWKSLAKELGIAIDREFNEELKGVSRTDSLERILAYGKKADVYTELEKEKFAAQKNELYLEMIKKMTPANLLPGISDLLHALKVADYKVGLSSASKNGPVILKLLGIQDLFDVVANPESVQAGKPAPDIFLKGAELLNVAPVDCVGVEDANAGITAINAAQMVSVGVGPVAQLGHGNVVLASTAELTVTVLENAWEKFHCN